MTAQPRDGEIGVLILAAGGSSRMGEPKQLLSYRGATLIERVAGIALSLKCGPVAMVLGASAEAIAPSVAHLPVRLVHNADWREGIGSSLRSGLASLLAPHPHLEAVLILLTDQPLIGRDALAALLAARRTSGRAIAAALYEGVTGVPAVFGSALFPELQALNGDTGARYVIRKHEADCIAVALPEAALDIDTSAEFAVLSAASVK